MTRCPGHDEMVQQSDDPDDWGPDLTYCGGECVGDQQRNRPDGVGEVPGAVRDLLPASTEGSASPAPPPAEGNGWGR